MHIAFVHNYYENLGIEYVSAYLKSAGHKTSIVFEPGLFGSFFAYNTLAQKLFSFKKEIIRKVAMLKPDIVAFSVISDNYAWACESAREIKKRLGVPVVFGGIHPSSVPEQVIKEDFVDFIIIGEGEEAFLELVVSLEDKKQFGHIKNLVYKSNGKTMINSLRPPLQNLDRLPFPDKDIFFNEYAGLINTAYTIVASRGCAFSCSYCVNSVINRIYPNGAYYRKRSVDNVIKELEWAKERYQIQKVTFYDDDFTLDKIWLKDFLIKYKDLIKLPFFCCIHPSNIDEYTVKLLVDSNCTTVNIGIQTFSEEIRKRILNRVGGNKEIIEALRILGKTKIFVYSNVMLGLPEQTEEEVLKTLEFCSQNRADIVSTYWLRYYPKTTVIDIARKLGFLSDAQIENVEKSRHYLPYAVKGSTFDKKISKIGNLILFSGIVPYPVMKFIIKHKYYNYFPSANLLFPAIFLVGLLKRLFEGKKYAYHYFKIGDYVKFYLYYMQKKLFIFLKHR